MTDAHAPIDGSSEKVIFQGIPGPPLKPAHERWVRSSRLVIRDGQLLWLEAGRELPLALPGQTGTPHPVLVRVCRVTVPGAWTDDVMIENIHVILTGERGEILADAAKGTIKTHKYAEAAFPLSAFETLLEYDIDVVEERIETFKEFHARHPDGTTNPLALAARRLVFRLS